MKLVRISASLAIVLAMAFLMSAPTNTVSAQGPAQRFECNYVVSNGTGTFNGTSYITNDAQISLAGNSLGGSTANRRRIAARVTTTIVSQSAPAANGTITAILSNVYEVNSHAVPADGVCNQNSDEECFATLDRATLVPVAGQTNVYKVIANLAIVAGGGAYKNACGKLTSSSNSDGSIVILNLGAATPTLTWSFEGGLCECQTAKSGPLDFGAEFPVRN